MIKKGPGGKAVAHAEERHAADEARRGRGGRRTGSDGEAAAGDGGSDDGEQRDGGRGTERRLPEGRDGGVGGGAQGAVVDVTEKEVGTSEAGAVYVREGLRGNADGEAVWWAGRRRRVMRMRDVRLVQRHQMGYVEMVSVTQENLRICKKIRSAYSRTGTEATGAAVRGDGEMDRRVLEDAVVDAGSGRGMYVVGSRWHEGTMIQLYAPIKRC